MSNKQKVVFLIAALAILLTACGPQFGQGDHVAPIPGANITLWSDPDPNPLLSRFLTCSLYEGQVGKIIDVAPHGQEGYAYELYVEENDCWGWISLGQEKYLAIK